MAAYGHGPRSGAEKEPTERFNENGTAKPRAIAYAGVRVVYFMADGRLSDGSLWLFNHPQSIQEPSSSYPEAISVHRDGTWIALG